MNTNLTFSLDTHQKMLKNVKGLMLGRIIILTLLLTITFLFQVSEKKYFFIPMTNNFYYFIGLFYWVTIVYSLFLKKIKDLHQYAFFQIIIDHLFITVLIYFTGGKESFFPITYIFSIIASSMIFYKRGALFSASLSSFLYGLLLLFQLHHWINPLGQPPIYDPSQIFYSLIIYMATFYIVAFLSSTISEELKKKKKELIQKQVDYNQLETFNRNIIRSLDSGLLTVDLSGKINFLNRTAEKILNRNEEELKHTSIYDLFPKINEVVEQVKRKVSEHSPDYQRYETLLTNHDGRKIYLGFSISPLTDPEGSLIGHTLIFQDITKFKEMEEQMKRVDKMAAVGVLAAGMAHEIRNPLASLSGSIQMLKTELTLDDHQQHLMEITLRESERLNALITDFLLFAQPPQTHKILYPIGRILEETIDLFIHSPSFHDGIRILRPGGHEEIRTSIDPDQMKQVFWNLLINAAQSMSNGGEIQVLLGKGKTWGATSLSLSSQLRGKEWIKISITDSGNGIVPEEKEKIFEPFFTTKENGTGLGLSIVHKIIENHKGLIKVESELDRGSTFSIFLPAD
ncbi:MAG: ATP-binding protein [Thermodesulfobacteriota bacterium]|jgi:two-component system sensor histidine kinase PilS (NtrC family)